MSKQTAKHQIRQPEKWVGKSVLHLDYHEYKWGGRGYFVCEWTGKLYSLTSEAYWGDYFPTMEAAWVAGYDEAAYYCDEGLAQMAARAAKRAA